MSQSTIFNLGGGPTPPVITIDGDVGSAIGPIITFLGASSGSSVQFNAAVSTVLFEVTDASGNTIVGNGAGNGTLTGTTNTVLGKDALNALTTGSDNIAIGFEALKSTTAGNNNIVIGGGTGNNFDLGDENIIIGYPIGIVAPVSNITFIGNVGTTSCYLAGINGVSLGNTATVVTMGGADPDQLGTAVITAGTGISVTPGANTITIASTAIGTINGNSGSATGSTITVKVNQASSPAYTGGSTVNFYASGSTNQLSFTDDLNNTGVGYNSLASLVGNGGSNTAFGFSSLLSVNAGDNNTAIGTQAGRVVGSGQSNTLLGYSSGLAVTDGESNTLIGVAAANRLVTGNYNIIVGAATDGDLPFTSASGYNYTSSESSNIIIGNLGVTGESNVLRIGTSGSSNGQVNKAYIAGVDGVNVGSVAKVLTMASEQIGTATITAGANITVTPGANTITIAANSTAVTYNYVSVNNAASPYTALSTDYYISADVTAGVISILLPDSPTTGRTFIIKDKVGLSATNNITVTTVGGAVTIDGSTSFVLNTAYESISVIFNGTSYEVL